MTICYNRSYVILPVVGTKTGNTRDVVNIQCMSVVRLGRVVKTLCIRNNGTFREIKVSLFFRKAVDYFMNVGGMLDNED